MHITLLAEGKMKDRHHLAWLQEYQKRISWNVQLKEVKQLSKLQPDPRQCIITLDETGQNLSSRALATMLQHTHMQGKAITLVIGGADGLPSHWKEAAHHSIAFGQATWPHMMVRVMVMEQLYRSYSILNGHPYHRG